MKNLIEIETTIFAACDKLTENIDEIFYFEYPPSEDSKKQISSLMKAACEMAIDGEDVNYINKFVSETSDELFASYRWYNNYPNLIVIIKHLFDYYLEDEPKEEAKKFLQKIRLIP